MGEIDPAAAREMQRRQADDLSARIGALINEWGHEQQVPTANAVISALAANLGDALAMISDASLRKRTRDDAAKVARHAERRALQNPRRTVRVDVESK